MRKRNCLPLETLAPSLLELPDPAVLLDFSRIFGNRQPTEMEVGFGKGLFLVTASQAHPEINYVGVEIDRGLQLYVANRITKRDLKNVRLVKADAKFFIRDYIPHDCLQAVHVYFPDPWWKKRHKKRRVFTEEFAKECERILVADGRLLIATDVEEYFQVMMQLVVESTNLKPLTDEAMAADCVTNFERKAIEQGRSVWRAIYRK